LAPLIAMGKAQSVSAGQRPSGSSQASSKQTPSASSQASDGQVPLLPTQMPQIDGSWTWLRQRNEKHHRDQRKEASELLCTALERGGYSCRHGGDIQHVNFKSIKPMKSKTQLVSHSKLPKLPEGQHRGVEFEPACSPIQKAMELTLSGFNVATVSAASAYHVGGGFTSGGRHALEEAFCSRAHCLHRWLVLPNLVQRACIYHMMVSLLALKLSFSVEAQIRATCCCQSQWKSLLSYQWRCTIATLKCVIHQ